MFNLKKLKQNAPAIPILIWIGFLVGIPFVYVVGLSFLSRDHLGNIVFQFTLENYRRIFDPVYLKVFINSFFLATLTGAITLLIGYPVAYYTANLEPKTKIANFFLLLFEKKRI